MLCNVCCVQVLSGAVKGFDLCLASEDLADRVKPLQKKLRKLMPTSRRGELSLTPATLLLVVLVAHVASGLCLSSLHQM